MKPSLAASVRAVKPSWQYSSNTHYQAIRYAILTCAQKLTQVSLIYCTEPKTKYTHIRLTALCPGLPGWAGTRKVKPIWTLLKQETVSGSGISWTVCKQSAPRSRQITTPTPYFQDLENVCPGICLAMMRTQMPKYTCPHTSVLCSNSFFAISLQHVTVMDIYSSMDAAIVLYIDMVSL